MSRSSASTSISASIKRIRSCPIHGVLPARRRVHSVLTPTAAKALIPSMEDLVLWKWDKITMAMSGGVDSAVALRILAEWPLDINVVFMRNWDAALSENINDTQPTSYAYSSDPSSSTSISPCGWQKDWEMVQKVCAHVGIPENRVKLVDLSKEYWTRVFEPALNVWENGGTPNPDVACNREIKFGALMRHMPRLARSFLATGHYARVKRVPHATRLCRAEDPNKDQSYYLSAITEAQLRRAVFPLERLEKEDTRKLAKYYGLPNADKEESMGLCFVGERGKFSNFISQYLPKPSVQGYIVDADGKQLAPHDGIWSFTVGQKAKIGGQLEPLFVAKKGEGESGQDILVVPGSQNPALYTTRIHTHDFHWIAGKTPSGVVPGGHKRALVQIRHRMEPVPAVISHDWNGGGLTIDFLQPVHGVAPGQVCAVFYLKWCLGSGVIKQTWTSDQHPVRTWKELRNKEDDEIEYFGAEEVQRVHVDGPAPKVVSKNVEKKFAIKVNRRTVDEPQEDAKDEVTREQGRDEDIEATSNSTTAPDTTTSSDADATAATEGTSPATESKPSAASAAPKHKPFVPPPVDEPLSEEEKVFASILTKPRPIDRRHFPNPTPSFGRNGGSVGLHSYDENSHQSLAEQYTGSSTFSGGPSLERSFNRKSADDKPQQAFANRYPGRGTLHGGRSKKAQQPFGANESLRDEGAPGRFGLGGAGGRMGGAGGRPTFERDMPRHLAVDEESNASLAERRVSSPMSGSPRSGGGLDRSAERVDHNSFRNFDGSNLRRAESTMDAGINRTGSWSTRSEQTRYTDSPLRPQRQVSINLGSLDRRDAFDRSERTPFSFDSRQAYGRREEQRPYGNGGRTAGEQRGARSRFGLKA